MRGALLATLTPPDDKLAALTSRVFLGLSDGETFDEEGADDRF